jgi:alcohol dehydrogenase (cytochrome c)
MSSLRAAAMMAAGVMALLAAAPAGAAPEQSVAAPVANPAPERPYVPVTDAMLQHPDPADWLMWRRTLNSWGFSPLHQITAGNVGGLRLMWARTLPAGGFEGTPLVHDGVMYIPEPGDRIEAVDAATGDPIWVNQRKYPADFKGRGGAKRNIAIWGDLLFSSGGDGTVYAVDARTGKQVWESQVTDYKTQAGGPSAGPIVANGKVISGRACSVQGGPDACVVVADDALTGKELWRTHTVALPGEPGADSWGDTPRDRRVTVGTWNPPSFDPELGLLYYGTSIASPTPKFELAGNDKDYLYMTSTIALDVNTGKIVWHYQHIHDFWDFDHTFERLLVDTEVAPDPKSVPWINPKIKPGEMRKVLTGAPGKTGIIYTLDRKTGEFLWARPTVRQNVLEGIDVSTGRAINNPASEFTRHDQALNICPAFTGGKNWPAGAYNPQTHLMLEPLQNICSVVTSDGPKSGPGLLGMNIDYTAVMAPGETNVGTVQAISAVTGKTEWKYQQRAGTMSLVDTAGGVLFLGDAVGHFHGIDDRTGKPLWDVNLSAPISGFPIAYGVGGKEFVAVGTGGSPEASGLGRMTPEIQTQTGNVLYVFALP